MESVKMTVVSDEAASRSELFMRFIWGALVGLVLGVIGTFAGMAMVVQWFHILILGKRQPTLQKFVNAYAIAGSQLKFYWLLATDERPPVMPDF